MSDAVEIYGQFGQTLAVAEATLNKLLETAPRDARHAAQPLVRAQTHRPG